MNRLQKYCTTKRLAAPWLALLCLLHLPIMGQRIAPYFKKGDRVCFVGNSITHNGEFHHNILQYYVTRFPQIPVRFYNAGLKGDVTGGILKRIDGDVMIHKPTHVVIMIGMNDVQRDLYGSSPTKDTDTLARRKAALELYRQNLDSIVQLFLKKGVRVMLQRPSAYDQTSTIKHPNNLGVNDALLECGRMMQQLAQRYKLHIIDYGTLMTDIAHTMQKKNPAATLSINDRVHPSSTGHFIMAYQFLKTAKAPATVSSITIDIHQLKANRTTTHGGINGARYQKDTLTFEILEKALPYPLSDQQQQANALVPFTQELNRQTLQVLHLKKGNYRLLIDSTTIATFSSEALQAGINLAIYNNTPQYQQALQVKKVLERLWENEATQRAVAFVDYMHLPPLAERTDMGIVKKYLDSLYAQRFKGQPYYSNAFEKYVTYKTQTLKLLQQADSLRDLAYQKAQPVVHRFTLQKIKEPTVAALIEASQSAAAPLLFDVNPSYLVNATNQGNVAEEFYPRRGLPHFIAKLKQPTPSLTVGFLGGSITKAEDQYRNQTLALIQSLYPNAKLKGINAGVSGTGTELGACRVQEQVIQYRPDLVFVEFAVNGGSNQALEGIVRQIKKRHPQTDICFLYTIAGDQYLQYARNEVPPKIRAFEKVADYYQIPSIHLGRYPAMLAMQDKLIWKSADAVQDKIVFSKDGTHPAKAGGDLYAQAIARALTVLTKEGLHQISTMPPPLYADNWEDGGMYAPVAIGTFTKDWDTIHPQGHPYLNGFAPWFTTIYKATAPKASFSFKFSGTAVGFFDIGGPEVGQVLVEIDGHCAALNRKAGNAANKLPNETGLACLNNRFNANCNNRYRGQFEIFDVPDGIHSVTITLSHLQADKSAILQGQDLTDIQTNPDRYNQQVFYLGKILIKGAAIVQ